MNQYKVTLASSGGSARGEDIYAKDLRTAQRIADKEYGAEWTVYVHQHAPTLTEIIIEKVFADPDVLGEILLSYAFIGEGRGCYSNFELRSSFRSWKAGAKNFAERLLGSLEGLSDYESTKGISSYLDPKLDLAVIWLWDGDGHLIFKLGDVVLENTDVKKSHGWRFCQ